jgi:phenylacetaldehyde dehydrogenase
MICIEEGAEVVSGGKKGSVQPTVLTNTKPEMKVVPKKYFGPVVCAEPITDDDLDDIAREANSTTYGLAASVWTRDISKANKLAKRIRAGTVWINCHNVFDASLPFGGYKESGWGREMGEFVLNNYTEAKAVTTAL